VFLAGPSRGRHCQTALAGADQTLDARYDMVDLPRGVVRQVERYVGGCRYRGSATLALMRWDGRHLRKQCARVRGPLFTFLDHSDVADNNSNEREPRPPQPVAKSSYCKITGGFRSNWEADLFAAIRSVIGTAKRRGVDAHQAHSGIPTQPSRALIRLSSYHSCSSNALHETMNVCGKLFSTS